MKTKKRFYNIFLLLLSLAILPSSGEAQFTEPEMIDYTNYPLFVTTATVKPNITIVLDNGQNMSENAYGSFPGDDLIVPESYHGGDSYMGIRRVVPLNGFNDVESISAKDNTYSATNNTLNLGYNQNQVMTNLVGIRFDNIEIPQGRTISKAWIEFMPAEDTAIADTIAEIFIYGQDDDDPGTFTGHSDLTSRNKIDPPISWKPGAWVANNPNNATTNDLTEIVQKLVNRSGWASGNAMAFLFTGMDGKRIAHSWDSDSFTVKANKDIPIQGGYAPVLHIEFVATEADQTRYYGIFSKGDWNDADVFEPVYYKYESSKFVRCDKSGVSCTADQKWEGNFLNWLTMRKIDIGMTALMGGFGSSRSTTNTHTSEAKSDNAFIDYDFYKWHDSTDKAQVSPYNGKYLYKVENGIFNVYKKTETGEFGIIEEGIKIVVDVDKDLDTERLIVNEEEGYVALNGIFENVGSKANWSFANFNKAYDGGDISKTFAEWSTINTSWLTEMQNFGMNDTPPTLAEMHYLITSYYMQDASILSGGYKPGTIYGDRYDPFKFTDAEIECPNNFVLYISTGGSRNDSALPSELIDYDGDGVDDAGNNQSFDDLTLYARTTDLRDDLDGEQNLITYVVYAFGNDDNDRKLLMNAAKQGGFEEKGGTADFPDLQNEWDKNGDNIPDTYFEASGGDDVQKKILEAINAMLNRAASGTAVSVLATRGEGEGTITQASFRPKIFTEDGEINWIGSLLMLWVDSFGNIREDDGDFKLEIFEDTVVRFFMDTDSGENMLTRYTPSEAYPYPHDNSTWTNASIDDLNPLWEASDNLKNMDSNSRTIHTNITDNETLAFTLANAGTLRPYLGVEDDNTWGIDAGLGATENNRVNNIINFIRGADESSYEGFPSLRLKKEDDKILKLGDIVNSTPVTVSHPVENYGSLYNDATYWTYYNQYINRETIVYVGANDGMLHAFTAGKHNSAQLQFETVGGTAIGNELWAYIPGSLLPHLKWLPQEGYTHVSYVDLDVRVTDAKIFDADDTHPEGWGSVLLGGLNLGGKDISTQNAGDFKPSVFAIDVTNPRDPKFMWEKSFAPAISGTGVEDLGLSTNAPGVIKVGDEWKLVYTSGPTDFDYDQVSGDMTVFSDQNACVYIVDMKTGEVQKDYTVPGDTFNDSYLATPAAFDKELNYNVDSIFMGCTYNNNASGAIFKITVPQTGEDFVPRAGYGEDIDDIYVSDASLWGNNFKLFALAPAPVTTSFNMSIDIFDNVWIYGGTGRFMDQSDKIDEAQNYLFGIKDPFFNKKKYNESGSYLNYAAESAIAPISIYPADNQLFPGDDYTIYSDEAVALGGVNKVAGGDGLVTTWRQLLAKARGTEYDGWYRSLCPGSITDEGICSNSGPSERIIKESSILSGIVLFPTFSPNSDICGFGGEGRLWAVYYETGTAFKEYIFGDPNQDPIQDVIYLGSGISSSFGLHIGRQEGSNAFTQMSTGIVLDLNLNIKTSTIQPTYWRNYTP